MNSGSCSDVIIVMKWSIFYIISLEHLGHCSNTVHAGTVDIQAKVVLQEGKKASRIVRGVIIFCIYFSFPWYVFKLGPANIPKNENDKAAQWANKLTLKVSLNFLYDIFIFSLCIKANTSSTLRSPSPLLSAERNTSFNQLNFVKENNFAQIDLLYLISAR